MIAADHARMAAGVLHAGDQGRKRRVWRSSVADGCDVCEDFKAISSRVRTPAPPASRQAMWVWARPRPDRRQHIQLHVVHAKKPEYVCPLLDPAPNPKEARLIQRRTAVPNAHQKGLIALPPAMMA